MSYPPSFLEAIDKCLASWREGRLAHAFIVGGNPRGLGFDFVVEFLGAVMGDPARIRAQTHVDVHFVEPQSRSRSIRIHQISQRQGVSDSQGDEPPLLHVLSQTSFSSKGWKAGVILFADCITDQAANALLKFLEEPPPRTLLFLVTDSPSSLLPTVRSRCQQIQLPGQDAVGGEPDWKKPLLEILREPLPVDPASALLLAERLSGLLGEIQEKSKEEVQSLFEAQETPVRKEVFEARVAALQLEKTAHVMEAIQAWRRDLWLLVLEKAGGGAESFAAGYLANPADRSVLARQAAGLTLEKAQASLERIGRVLQLLEKKFKPLPVFEADYLQSVI